MTRNWLLLRGWSREQRHWGEFPERMRQRIPGGRVACLDLPGVGEARDRSPKTRVPDIVDDLRSRFEPDPSESWGVLGVSFGGMLALDWAARYPLDFAAVAVSNTSSRGIGTTAERLHPRNVGTIARVAAAQDPRARERLIVSISSNAGADIRERVALEWAKIAAESPVSLWTSMTQLWAASRFEAPVSVSARVLVMASDADRLVSSACARRLADRLGAALATHPSAGHDLPLDDPSWVADRVAEFAHA